MTVGQAQGLVNKEIKIENVINIGTITLPNLLDESLLEPETIATQNSALAEKALVLTQENTADLKAVDKFGVRAHTINRKQHPLNQTRWCFDPFYSKPKKLASSISGRTNFGETGRFCAVALHDHHCLYQGKIETAVEYQNRTYSFSNDNSFEAFMMDPRKYLEGEIKCPPLRISFAGSFGSGKSTFIKKLAEKAPNVPVVILPEHTEGHALKDFLVSLFTEEVQYRCR
jgi:YHS domain-containing protein